MSTSNPIDLEQEISSNKYRKLDGKMQIVTQVIFAVLPLIALFFALNIPNYFGFSLFTYQGLAFFLALLLFNVFLVVPFKKGLNKVPWYDFLFAVLSLITGLYLAFFFQQIFNQMGQPTYLSLIFGAIFIVMLLEAVRRVFGMALVVIALVFIIYARYSDYFGGFLEGKGYSWPRIIEMLYYLPDGILGVPLAVVVTIVVVFLLFGQLLTVIGAADAMKELSMALMGKTRGGPAKIAIFASGLLGTISGSAAGNVATTGVLTIPLMKRIGYKPEFAAGVEAVASTGGQILPPVMGAAAFLMAEYLSIPYSQVVIAAFLPALLYYLTAFIQVDLVAGKNGLKGLDKKEIPLLKECLKKSYSIFLPLIFLIVLLMGFHYDVVRAGIYTVLFTIGMSFFIKDKRLTLASAYKVLVDTGQSLTEVSVVSALAGIIMGVVALTGVGISLSQFLISLAQSNLYLLLIFTAVAGIILGMGMTAAAVYILLVVLLGPGLIQAGIEPIAAHMFIFYFGMMSFITPPICIAAYVAAGIADTDPIRTSFIAVKLGLSGYIVPFIFIFEPELLMVGTFSEALLTFSFVALGMAALCVAMVGYLHERIGFIERIIFAVLGILLVLPGLQSRIIGVALMGIVALAMVLRKKKNRNAMNFKENKNIS